MPREGYITKGNIAAYNQKISEMTANQQVQNKQEAEELKAYYKLQTESNTLINNKRSGSSGQTKDDSVLMQNVKQSLSTITKFYTETPIPASEEDFNAQLTQLQSDYKTLQNNCQVYLNTRQSFWKGIIKGEGYRRYKMVQAAQTKAYVELALLKNRAQLIYNDFKDVTADADRPLWVNVLAEARTSYLDLANKNTGKVEYTGGNCNSVIKLTSPNETVAYIKEETRNIPAAEYTDAYIEKLLESKLGQNFLKENNLEEKDLKDIINALSTTFSRKDSELVDKFFNNWGPKTYSAKDMRKEAVINRMRDYFLDENTTINNKVLNLLDKKKLGYDIFGEFAEYFYLHNLSHGIARDNVKMDNGSSLTNRNVATRRLAELLGVPELVPATQKVKYKDKNNNKDHYGIIMAQAKGDQLFKASFKVYNPQQDDAPSQFDSSVFLQMNTLQILDVIAGQTDRNSSNIIVEGTVAKVDNRRHYLTIKAIDNDMCFGKLTYNDIKKRNSPSFFLNTIEDKNGFCKLKVVDKRLYDSLMVLTDEMVDYVFADLLSKNELKALKDRIKGVKKLLKHSKDKSKQSLLKVIDPNDKFSDDVRGAKDRQANTNCYWTKLDLLRN